MVEMLQSGPPSADPGRLTAAPRLPDLRGRNVGVGLGPVDLVDGRRAAEEVAMPVAIARLPLLTLPAAHTIWGSSCATRGSHPPTRGSTMVSSFGFGFGHTGSAPSPFDALNGPRLAGGEGSHPLHSVAAEELLRPTDGAVTGQIALDHPARVGDGITGRIRFVASEAISARRAYLRLVGLRLDEVRRSEEHRNSKGEVTYTEHWVETSGNLFSHDAFLEPPVPTSVQP